MRQYSSPKGPATHLLSSQMFSDCCKKNKILHSGRHGPVQTFFWDVLLPWNSRWDNIFHETVQCFTFSIRNAFFLLWIKHWFWSFASHCTLFIDILHSVRTFFRSVVLFSQVPVLNNNWITAGEEETTNLPDKPWQQESVWKCNMTVSLIQMFS